MSLNHWQLIEMKRRLVIFLTILSTLISCKEGTAQGKSQPVQTVKVNQVMNDAANFLSGTGQVKNAALQKLRATAAYKSYQRQLATSWNSYKARTLNKVVHWRQRNIEHFKYDTLFYPFGGPDLLNALAFFPEAERYILLGLEPVGHIPAPHALGSQANLAGLNRLKGALLRILGHNFFHTKIMAYKIGSHQFNGLTGMLMFFISRSGYQVTDVRKVILGSDGAVLDLKKQPTANSVYGVEVSFRKEAGAPVQKVYYFRGDISDQVLHKKASLERMISKSSQVASMMKAASYLMFRNSFDDIRNLVLFRSNYIVQDPSGFPYHYLKSKDFKLSLYGDYVRPIPLFKIRCQPDLAREIKKKRKANLPFSYGYTAPRYGKSVLMVAERVTPLRKMVYDASMVKGQNTYCSRGRLVIEKK